MSLVTELVLVSVAVVEDHVRGVIDGAEHTEICGGATGDEQRRDGAVRIKLDLHSSGQGVDRFCQVVDVDAEDELVPTFEAWTILQRSDHGREVNG